MSQIEPSSLTHSSMFLTTCIFSAAQTSAVTEIHSTSRSLSRFFLSTVLLLFSAYKLIQGSIQTQPCADQRGQREPQYEQFFTEDLFHNAAISLLLFRPFRAALRHRELFKLRHGQAVNFPDFVFFDHRQFNSSDHLVLIIEPDDRL